VNVRYAFVASGGLSTFATEMLLAAGSAYADRIRLGRLDAPSSPVTKCAAAPDTLPIEASRAPGASGPTVVLTKCDRLETTLRQIYGASGAASDLFDSLPQLAPQERPQRDAFGVTHSRRDFLDALVRGL